MKRQFLFPLIIGCMLPLGAIAQCHDEIHIGDTMKQVIDKCGQPKWRERTVKDPGQHVELIRGLDSLQTTPVNPEIREKWYYVTSQDKTTVIEILDAGVLSVRQLERDPNSPANME